MSAPQGADKLDAIRFGKHLWTMVDHLFAFKVSTEVCDEMLKPHPDQLCHRANDVLSFRITGHRSHGGRRLGYTEGGPPKYYWLLCAWGRNVVGLRLQYAAGAPGVVLRRG